MSHSRLPLVADNHLRFLDGEQPTPVVVGSDAWYNWLAAEQNRSFSFRNHLGTFTVRRERKRRGWYWYVYCKREGKLRKTYVGKTQEVTLERLNAVAVALAGQDTVNDSPTSYAYKPGRKPPQVLAQSNDESDGFLLASTSAFAPSHAPGSTPRHNLPAQFTSLIGREQDIAAVCTLLRRPEVRLLTLTGIGGIGKTRLALQVATELLSDFANGVCFVSLAPISAPDLVLSTVAQTLGLREIRAWSVPMREQLQTYLREKHMLLILDNFEQVVAAAHELAYLLAACPHLKLLVTSRAVLHVPGEQEFSLASLALPDLRQLADSEALSQCAGVELFLQRAQALKPDFQITSTNARAIAEVCVRLDGLPLAIELAAARIRLLPPQALLTRLSQCLSVLTGGARTLPERQQTLRNTLRWSYDLLNAEEQWLFRQLSVFVGGCMLEVVEAVCHAVGNDTIDVLNSVESLIDKSLLQQSEQESEEPRLFILQTVREYGLECLRASGEAELIQQVHAQYYLAWAEEAESQLKGNQQLAWLERLEQEQENLRVALNWLIERQETELALRLCEALWHFWHIRGYWSEGRRWLEAALGLTDAQIRTAVRARVLCGAGTLASRLGDMVAARSHLEASVALARELGDKWALAEALGELGWSLYQQSDLVAARTLLEESVAHAREVEDRWTLADALLALGIFLYYQGDNTGAQRFLEESEVLARDLGDRRTLALTLVFWGRTAREQGNFKQAVVRTEEGLTLARMLDYRRAIAEALFLLGHIAKLQGEYTQAAVRLEECLALARETGDKRRAAYALCLWGYVALRQGDARQAATRAQESLTLFRVLGSKADMAIALSVLGEISLSRAELVQALVLYHEGLMLGKQAGRRLAIGWTISGLARVAAAEEQPLRAACLLGAADLWWDLNVEGDPVSRADYTCMIESLRTQLGEQTFRMAWAEGHTMTPEQVLALLEEYRVGASTAPTGDHQHEAYSLGGAIATLTSASKPSSVSSTADAHSELHVARQLKSPQRCDPLHSLQATKLHAPHLRAQLIPRPQLTARLQQGLQRALTLLSAPAGFGKTTLLAQWLAQSGMPVAWLSLGPEENDPAHFLACVIAALQTLDADLGKEASQASLTALALLHTPQPSLPEKVLAMLTNELTSRETGDFALVLDDYHVISAKPIQSGMTYLVEHLPPHMHLVLATRADPPLPLARLRAQGQLTELRAAELRFAPAEVSAFLHEVMGLELPPELIATLEKRTEGWIAGLQLAALSLQGRTDVAQFLATFSGSHRFVLDYLSEEVLARQPVAVQQFLLHTSILERLSASLCDAVTGQETGQAMLEALDRANLFVVPLDDERRWYRYHHLFADVLRTLLQQVESTILPALHRRASAWYEQHDLPLDAVQHALAIPDFELTARLIEPIVFTMAFHGQIYTLLGWLKALPEELICARPFLCTYHAAMLMFTNQLEAALARAQDAERVVQQHLPAEQARTLLAYVLVLRACIADYFGDITQAVALAHQALDLLPQGEVIFRTGAIVTAAHAYQATGDVTVVGEREVATADAFGRAVNDAFAAVRTATLLGRLYVLQGRLSKANATYEQVMQVVSSPEVLQTIFCSLLYYFGKGDLLREWNELDAAERYLSQGMTLVKEALTLEPCVATLGYSALARLQQARGNTHEALATLDALARLAEQRHFAPHLMTQGAAVRAQVELAQGNTAAAIHWAHASGLSADDEDLSYPREVEYLVLARVRIAQGRDDPAGPGSNETRSFLQEALHLLERLQACAESNARMGSVLEILVLRALALEAQRERTAALSTLERALTLAEPQGYVRLFVDEGAPMLALLRQCHARGIFPCYVATLLAAFGEQNTSASSLHGPRSHALVEPLTERECEVLRLLLEGASNRELAHRLVLSVNTVKKHIYNICGKLGVQSRTQAIVKAKLLNLL